MNTTGVDSNMTHHIRHFLDDFQAGTLAILFTNLCIRVDNLVVELADGLLKRPMTLGTKKIGI